MANNYMKDLKLATEALKDHDSKEILLHDQIIKLKEQIDNQKQRIKDIKAEYRASELSQVKLTSRCEQLEKVVHLLSNS